MVHFMYKEGGGITRRRISTSSFFPTIWPKQAIITAFQGMILSIAQQPFSSSLSQVNSSSTTVTTTARTSSFTAFFYFFCGRRRRWRQWLPWQQGGGHNNNSIKSELIWNHEIYTCFYKQHFQETSSLFFQEQEKSHACMNTFHNN